VIESQFESSLNPEQKEQYEKAREQRRQVRDRFFSKYGNKLSKYYEGM
jgi:hypothetical protein